MKLIKYNHSDHYELFSAWTKARGWLDIDPNLIPDGYLAVHDSKPVCMCFVYLAVNAPIGFQVFPVSNPDFSDSIVHVAFKTIQLALDELAVSNGCTVLYAESPKQIVKLYENLGFETLGEGITTMAKSLNSNTSVQALKE